MKKSLTALTLALLLAHAPVFAQDAAPAIAPPAPATAAANTPSAVPPKPDEATMKAAAEFVEVTQSTTIIDKLLPVVARNFSALLLRDNPGQMGQINQVMQSAFVPAFNSHIDGYKRHMAFVYATNLSREQLQQLIVFYKSPIGQAYLKVMPTIMEQTMSFAKTWMTENVGYSIGKLVPELQKANLNIPKELQGKPKP